MVNFTKKQKQMANFSEDFLKFCCASSEKELVSASKLGDKNLLNKCMKEHQDYEYALLYKNSPKFKGRVRKK